VRYIHKKEICFVLITAIVSIVTEPHAQSRPHIRDIDRIRLAEAFRIADQIGDSLWEGWKSAPFALLLVTHDREYLMHHPQPSKDFTLLGYDSLLETDVYVRNRTKPIGFLATFPAIQGSMIPTIVVGQAESTDVKTSTPWVVTLLHEHFHQLQMSQPGYYAEVESLKLSHGDQTGMWMLNFPFPYDSANVQEAFSRLSALLVKGILPMKKSQRLKLAADYRRDLDRFAQTIGVDNFRYLSFELWQEGIARYTEYRMARMSASMYKPGLAFSRLGDFRPFRPVADSIYQTIVKQLSSAKLGTSRRALVYPFGAAEGLLLDNVSPGWHSKYLKQKFFLQRYFTPQ